MVILLAIYLFRRLITHYVFSAFYDSFDVYLFRQLVIILLAILLRFCVSSFITVIVLLCFWYFICIFMECFHIFLVLFYFFSDFFLLFSNFSDFLLSTFIFLVFLFLILIFWYFDCFFFLVFTVFLICILVFFF